MFKKNKTKMLHEEKKSIGINNTVIATIDTVHSLITGPPGIVEFHKEDIAYTVIQNCAPYLILIERIGPLLGFAEHHTEEAKSEQLDKKIHCKSHAKGYN
jgi:hypothetical protein